MVQYIDEIEFCLSRRFFTTDDYVYVMEVINELDAYKSTEKMCTKYRTRAFEKLMEAIA